ncbi:glutathionylspermidine synthase family protein [Planosporangium flavigriseum]|uniref:Putative glutathionylspermidine synthase n=1 Tax=Planosporangium flavigriseum TaxID=373681 RepID=A0A8J3LNT0_9ACTN|nr:glutathionylspermidine synthase family protein [Planosporangium flavigriseum]NJC65848.1 glutathionylspermidine synthase family protein [Planosporangium flavigriseum]GIG76107.1 putative glutathionylspermidine synthase [Planosporangium flavigriseum]
MRRHPSTPRPGWRQTVESQGLVFPVTVCDDGSEIPYWYESAYYELTMSQVEELEEVTETLHGMAVEAARFLATGAMGNLGLPALALDLARDSLAKNPPSLYGRFDLRYDGTGPAKMLEYNADTPTGLLESAVAQYFWADDVFPDRDQWNSLHDRLVMAWRTQSLRFRSNTVHFAHSVADESGEEWMTVAYLRDTADQAGLDTVGLTVEDIGYDKATGRFVDLAETPIDTCFKLYPWEDMLAEEFGVYVMTDPDSVTWLEPLWKVLLSNKALLAAMWHLYPDHPNLLPAYLVGPGPLTEWVAKPLHGREGANIRIHADGVRTTQPGGYGDEGWCYQQWCPLPDFDGNKAVLGSWIVDGKAAGVGIRESDSWVTDFYARFVPHVIDAPRPDEATIQRWLAESRPG